MRVRGDGLGWKGTVRGLLAFGWVWVWVCCTGWGRAAELPAFDLTREEGRSGWIPLHDVTSMRGDGEGWHFQVAGGDPYVGGPPADYPEGVPLWMHLRIRSETGGPAQVFHYTTGPREEESVRFHVKGGGWREVRVPLPALGRGTRLRLDPPGTRGACSVAWIRFETRLLPKPPVWVGPTGEGVAAGDSVRSAGLELVHGPGLGRFEIRVGGERMALGHDQGQLGYIVEGVTRWVSLKRSARVVRDGAGLQVEAAWTDPDGGRWEWRQTFRPAKRPGGVDAEVRVRVDRDRNVLHLPWMMIFPGMGTYGTNKVQGLFPGVEYLENEPSSSEADVVGPGALRTVPDRLKITMPLLAIAARDRYLGVLWEERDGVAALHDSPDRIFGSGGHVFGWVFPGSDPSEREDGRLMPYGGRLMRAGEEGVWRGTIVGGEGKTVIPAVQEWVVRKGLPARPAVRMTVRDYARWAARGWLDTEIREGFRFRHAVGNGFGSAAVADAPVQMRWLAAHVGDAALASRLETVAAGAEALVPVGERHRAAVGHLRQPLAPLVLGGVMENVESARAEGWALMQQFDPDGGVRYRAPKGALDLGRTHFSREANGLAGARVARLLECAAFSGDAELIRGGLRVLRALERFRDGVPRGAQTWEVPLHTPDILASAHLVRAYVLGYEMGGGQECLDQARGWAWTGVPFVYLKQPTTEPVGVYGTIPVLGATQYIAPLWIGLPVQWCGLVYGNAIRHLARHDPSGPWLALADGMALAGLQHALSSAPEHTGLLPDSFDLRAQAPNPVPINPGTLFPEIIQALGGDAAYGQWAFLRAGVRVHAPGSVRVVSESKDGLEFEVTAWGDGDRWVLMNGFRQRPEVGLNGMPAVVEEGHEWHPKEGCWVIRFRGRAQVKVRLGRE